MTAPDTAQREVPGSAKSRSKATLFCMDCGHSGHPSRDWRQRTDGTVVCPACGTVVAERAPPHGDRDPGTGILQAWTGLVVASSMLGPRVLRSWCPGQESTRVGAGSGKADRR